MFRPSGFRCSWRAHCAWAVSISLLIGACSSVVAPVIPSVSGPSEDEETKISREFRREAKKFLKIVNNPEVERYVAARHQLHIAAAEDAVQHGAYKDLGQ